MDGISKELLEKVLSYSYTTVSSDINNYTTKRPFIYGLGMGNHVINKCTALLFWGGNLDIVPVENYWNRCLYIYIHPKEVKKVDMKKYIHLKINVL